MNQGLENVEKTIRDYLPTIIHMSLATSANNRPWVCEVHFYYDDDLNIYFRSETGRRHSQEIAQNPRVAGNIVSQHGKSDKPRGIYFEGTAEHLENVDENHPAYLMAVRRFEMGPEILEKASRPDGTHFYKITVSDFYVFDARESQPGRKYHLPWASNSGYK
jgi:uncharacterized protein YhbP (UPF0306 family)